MTDVATEAMPEQVVAETDTPVWRSSTHRIPTSWAVAGVAAWLIGLSIATSVEPAGADTISPPWIVSNAVTIASWTLLATFIGLAMRRRFALVTSAITAGFLISTTSWCAVHLGIGRVLVTQVGIVSALFAASLVGLARHR